MNDLLGAPHGKISPHTTVTWSYQSIPWLWHPVGKIEIIPGFSNAEEDTIPDI